MALALLAILWLRTREQIGSSGRLTNQQPWTRFRILIVMLPWN